MSPTLPKIIQNLSFLFIIIAYFLIFFNDFLGFEGALGIVLLLSIFVKLKFFKSYGSKFTSSEKLFIFSVFFYILMMVVSTLINYEDLKDVDKFFAKYNKVLYFVGFVYLFKYIKFSFDKFEIFIKFMAYLTILMLTIEVLIFGLGTHLGGELSNRGTGAWFFSSVLIATIFLSMFKVHVKQYNSSIHYAILSLILLLVIVFTSTRSIWLSLFIALLITVPLAIKFFDLRKIVTLKNSLALSISLILFLGIGSNQIEKKFAAALNDIQEIQDGEFYNSLGLRLVMYKIAFNGIKENPLTGLGEVNYKRTLIELYQTKIGTEDEKIYKQISKFKQIHNQFLMDAWMKGVFGFLSLVLLFILSLIIFYKHLNTPENITIGLIGISYLVTSFIFFQFGAVLTYSHGIVFFILWLVLLMSVLSNKANHEESL